MDRDSETVYLEKYKPLAKEKMFRILHFLDVLNEEPDISNNVGLHGGTALNLFIHFGSRLSLDADINYFGNLSFEEIQKVRPSFESLIYDVAREQGYKPKPGKISHAGHTVKLMYASDVTKKKNFLSLI